MKNNLRRFFQIAFTLLIFSVITNAQNINKEDKIFESVNDTKRVKKDDADLIKTPQIVDFSGEAADEVFPNKGKGWQFFGLVRQIKVSGSERIVGFGSAVFGTNSGTSRIAISLCYLKKGGAITSFAENNHLNADVDNMRRTFSVSVTGTLAEGIYSVGYCVVNQGKQILDNNGYVNGWLMVVN